MPRPPGQKRTHPTRAATPSRHRVEPWFTDAEWDVLRAALDREPDAAGVRSLALASAVLLNEKGGCDDRG